MDNNFALFIDDLRKSRNISKVDFVDGIVSERQYYRFINGESSLKSEVIIKFFDKLELSLQRTIYEYQAQSSKQHRELRSIYENLFINNEKEAFRLISEFDDHAIVSNFDKKLYKFIKLTSSGKLNVIPMQNAIDGIIELIDYPNLLNKKSLNFIESSGLIYISKYLFNNGDTRIAFFAYNLINENHNNNKISFKQSFPFYITTANSLGKIGEHDKVVNVCNHGLKDFVSFNEINVYEALLYNKALAERAQNKPQAYKKTLTRLFCQLYAEDNMNRFEEYKKVTEKRFNLKVSDLLKIM